jgi:Na+/proline symporter
VTAGLLASFIAAYFLLLLWVAWRTSRGADNESFFIGNRSSHWAVVAFGMVGTSLSGVTFVSVPGAVGSTSWHYLQIVIGNVIGYGLVAWVLLPLYYRLELTSIYGFLRQRMGMRSYRTGAGYFIVSRTLGATARLYIVVRILQDMVLAELGFPFWFTAAVILLMIVLYTVHGGVKTIVWTDTLQTAGMLTGLVACTVFLLQALDITPWQAYSQMRQAGLATVFGTEVMPREFWAKQITAGIFIALAMTGMDQEMMQKNISVRTLAGAQKNMLVMAAIFFCVVLSFLFLGGLLHLFATQQGLAARGDALFPAVVMQHLPVALQLVFILALISALFPSADGALTALTSSFCIDILGLKDRAHWSEAHRRRVRLAVHLGFALLFMALVMGFRWLDDPSMIGLILKIASYTYGPLLGLFAFGILTRRVVRDRATLWASLAALAAAALLDGTQQFWLAPYRIGLELLLVNGLLTFAGLWLLSTPAPEAQPPQAASSVRR